MSLDSGRSPDSAEGAEEGGTAAGPEAPGDTGSPAEPDADAAPGAAPVAAPGQEPGGASESGVPGAGGLPGDTGVDLDAPLLADVAGLRASWQRIQAGFVDDPREAVSDAANLVEHTAQALVGALQQRQRLLRAGWDRGRTLGGFGAPEDDTDTEELRLLIQRYRILFNHICRP